jgi:hypothetical protein
MNGRMSGWTDGWVGRRMKSQDPLPPTQLLSAVLEEGARQLHLSQDQTQMCIPNSMTEIPHTHSLSRAANSGCFSHLGGHGGGPASARATLGPGCWEAWQHN